MTSRHTRQTLMAPQSSWASRHPPAGPTRRSRLAASVGGTLASLLPASALAFTLDCTPVGAPGAAAAGIPATFEVRCQYSLAPPEAAIVVNLQGSAAGSGTVSIANTQASGSAGEIRSVVSFTPASGAIGRDAAITLSAAPRSFDADGRLVASGARLSFGTVSVAVVAELGGDNPPDPGNNPGNDDPGFWPLGPDGRPLTPEEQLQPFGRQSAQAQTQISLLGPAEQFANIRARLAERRQQRQLSLLSGLRLRDGEQSLSGETVGQLLVPAGGGASADEAPVFDAAGFFISGDLGRGTQRSNARIAGFRLQTQSLTAGFDYRFGDNSVAGISLGFQQGNADYARDVGEQRSRAVNLSVFGSLALGARGYLDGGINLGRIRFEGERETGFGKARSRTDGRQVGVFVDAGIDFNHGALLYGPYARAEWIRGSTDAYIERGRGGFRLSDQETTTRLLSLGGSASYARSTSFGILVPTARIEWVHQTRSDDALGAALVDNPLISAEVLSAGHDDNYFLIGAGVSAVLPDGVTVYGNYDRSLANQDFDSWRLNLGARLEF